MPKLFLPPQGGEKWLCIFTFLFMMLSVVCTVVMIYCIVIIYLPSMVEAETNFIGPKRCTTTLIERNISNAFQGDTKCNWSSCAEWCLSKQSIMTCSKMYGILREVGVSVSLEQCDLEEGNLEDLETKQGPGGFLDHTCQNEEDLPPFNCKRSKFETKEPGQREVCMGLNSLISCEAGLCKNISRIWDCEYKDSFTSLEKRFGSKGERDGYCNCNRCPEDNTTGIGEKCEKSTEYCFLETGQPDSINDEKWAELCKDAGCQTCRGICEERHQCLNMKSRRDVVYFGIDEYGDSLLTYYKCTDGDCVEINDMKCNRTCDSAKFDISAANYILLEGERVVLANCKKALINGTVMLPSASLSNSNLNKMMAACSDIRINKEMNSIEASDCVNGTWFEDLGVTDYNTITKKYSQHRSDQSRWVQRSRSEDKNLIPWQQHLVIFNKTKILKNQEGCVNTLSMECMDFYHRYGRDGANYTSRATFDCFYDPENHDHVIIDYQPERTKFYLLLWSLLPGTVMFISCIYMCVCSKFMFTSDDGHMRIFCCGKAVTGIGEVAVYKAPGKNKS